MHVRGERGEAKFCLEPRIELAKASGLSTKDLARIRRWSSMKRIRKPGAALRA